jgi:hypothetical protein
MGYMPGPAAITGARTDGLAIGALIVGILAIVCSWLCLGILLGPAAGVMGYIARKRVTASGGTLGGGGMALAGLICGVVGFVFSAGWALLWIYGFSHPGNSIPTTSP